MDALTAAFLGLVSSLRHNFGTLRYLEGRVKAKQPNRKHNNIDISKRKYYNSTRVYARTLPYPSEVRIIMPHRNKVNVIVTDASGAEIKNERLEVRAGQSARLFLREAFEDFLISEEELNAELLINGEPADPERTVEVKPGATLELTLK